MVNTWRLADAINDICNHLRSEWNSLRRVKQGGPTCVASTTDAADHLTTQKWKCTSTRLVTGAYDPAS